MEDSSIITRLRSNDLVRSFEFFPPKKDIDSDELTQRIRSLMDLSPDFVSVTYGAGGSTRQGTHHLTRKLKEDFGMIVMPHLTCVGGSREEIAEILRGYRSMGFRNIMALRGDLPGDSTSTGGEFQYASDLIRYIKEAFPEFCIGAAGYPEGHPESDTMERDLENTVAKINCGVDFITTQLFFDNASFLKYRELMISKGVQCPIVPGLFPALGVKQMERFCGMCGAQFPNALREKMEKAGGQGPDAAMAGAEWCALQLEELIREGIPGFHLYVMNREEPARAIFKQLALAD